MQRYYTVKLFLARTLSVCFLGAFIQPYVARFFSCGCFSIPQSELPLVAALPQEKQTTRFKKRYTAVWARALTSPIKHCLKTKQKLPLDHRIRAVRY